MARPSSTRPRRRPARPRRQKSGPEQLQSGATQADKSHNERQAHRVGRQWWLERLRQQVGGFMARRPHRSFRLTNRHDTRRSFALPGYLRFTVAVGQQLWSERRLFIPLALVLAFLMVLTGQMVSQETYSNLVESLRQVTDQSGLSGQFNRTVALLFGLVAGGGIAALQPAQQVLAVLFVVLVWLSTVWLLRQRLAGAPVRMRDGLYNGSAPLISTFLVFVVLLVQLLPIGIAMLGYAAAQTSGLLSGGVEAMVFWAAFVLLVVLALYWATGSFIALIVVTLPGMYPLRALRAAGDMVVGRRIRIVLRIVWMLLGVALGWLLVLVPLVLFDAWLQSIWEWYTRIPLVPLTVVVMVVVSTIWSSTYVYLLYRKLVDDDAPPVTR